MHTITYLHGVSIYVPHIGKRDAKYAYSSQASQDEPHHLYYLYGHAQDSANQAISSLTYSPNSHLF